MSTQQYDSTWIALRAVIISFFVIVGLIANGIVLQIYMGYKGNQKQASHLYIIILAWLDLISCCVILPQMPLFKYGIIPQKILGVQFSLQLQSYVFVQVAMVLDRFFAVFYPFKFHQIRRKTNIVLLIAFILIQSLTQFLGILVHVLITIIPLVAVCIFGLFTTFLAYPAIAIKLWRQNRQINPTETQRIQTLGVTSRNVKMVSETQQRTAHHIKTLKLFIAVLTLYLMSFLPLMLTMALSLKGMETPTVYLYYINNVGNPFIYFIFISSFRNDVKALFGKWFLKIRSCTST